MIFINNLQSHKILNTAKHVTRVKGALKCIRSPHRTTKMVTVCLWGLNKFEKQALKFQKSKINDFWNL